LIIGVVINGSVTFLPLALAFFLLIEPLQLSFIGVGLAVAVALCLFNYFRGYSEYFDPKLGVIFIGLGITLFGITIFVCNKYGLTMESLGQDRSFPSHLRRLPYFSIAFLANGVLIAFISVLKG
jgi:hypothetical protein